MAPPRSGARKPAPREADYSNIGVAGRRTGITLKDSGVRDEYGMEPIDGIFSSPDKTPARNKRKSNHTITSESDMDIDQTGAIPDPRDALRASRSSLPLARSRSPIKTNLGTPARRSVGATSSPTKAAGARRSNERSSPLVADSPSRVRPTHAAPPRRVGLSRPQPRPVVEAARPVRRLNFDLMPSDDEQPQQEEDGDLYLSADQEDDDEMLDVNGAGSPIYEEGGEGEEEEAEEAEEDDGEGVEAEEDEEENDGTEVPQIEEEEPSPPPKQSPQRTKKSKAPPTSTAAAAPPAKRGRPRKTTNLPDEHRPAKRAKKDVPPPAKPKTTSPSDRRTAKASVSTPEHPSAMPPPAKRGRKPKAQTTEENVVPAKPRSRGLRILRSETPASDYGATVMRSGRTSVKPLAYWRNERAVYGTGRVEGRDRELGGIKEIIRTEEISPEPQPKSRKRANRKRRTPEAIEEDDEIEEWEANPGYLEGRVPKWDPLTGHVSEDAEEEIEIAYAPKGLELATREVKNATFLYGKTLSLPFFHSGIVDLPPGGEKRPKNSRVNHIVFWVFTGRVDVGVSDNQFSIGRGGMWQVPRGNFYSIQNPYDRPARVFFAQGCYMQEEEAGADADSA